MTISLNRALKTGSLAALALCGCATAKEEAVFEGSSPGTYWELVGWDSHEATGSWKPWTEPEYEGRERSVVYVNEFRRRGWGTVAPWCWFSNGRCFLYQVMAWQEVQPADDSHTTPVQDPGNRFEAAYHREDFIPRFLEKPREYLAETEDPEAADQPRADAADIERACGVVPRGLVGLERA